MHKSVTYPPRGSERANRALGFTLVELVVVSAIITVLVGVLLPALNRAREQATLLQCQSNLRQWGQVAYNFSLDHRGRFPESWGSPNITPPYSYRGVPNTITGDELPDPSQVGGTTNGTWLSGGTNWDTFKQYGLTWAVANCPATPASSCTTETTTYSSATGWVGHEVTYNAQQWGREMYHVNYLYVGGLAAELNQPPGYMASPINWGTRVPAGKTSEDNLCEKILACDAVVDFTSWSQGYMINHPVPGKTGYARFVNILYGDGHVTRDSGPTLVPAGTNGYNISWFANLGPFFYWGQ